MRGDGGDWFDVCGVLACAWLKVPAYCVRNGVSFWDSISVVGTTGKGSSLDVTSQPDGKAFPIAGLLVDVKA